MSDIFEGITPNIADYYSRAAGSTGSTQKTEGNWWELPDKPEESTKSNTDLSFEDMLMLMVTQLQNQTIDNQADTNDMMNQLIQMTVMQALTEMSTQVEDLTNANIMTYSASLVGKEVTVGVLDNKGNLTQEIVGEVTATGTYNGQQVIFIGDQCFPLSSIMAVGTLPEQAVEGGTKPVEPADPEDPEEPKDPEDPGETPPPTDETETDENKPVEETGGDQEPQLPPEDTSEADDAERVNGTQEI